MSIPGFSAEVAMYGMSEDYYQETIGENVTGAVVTPQAWGCKSFCSPCIPILNKKYCGKCCVWPPGCSFSSQSC